MGCCYCCKKSKELKELEDELDMIVSEKRILEMKVYSQENKLETDTSSVLSHENVRFMDYDLYTSLKIVEGFSGLVTEDADEIHSLTQKVQKVGNLKSDEKIIKYGEVRCQTTEIQKKILGGLQDSLNELIEIVNGKYNSLEERIEKIESLLLNSEWLIEERQTVIKAFKEIVIGKKDFCLVLGHLRMLENIESDLNEIERQLPALNHDPMFMLKLREIEIALASLTKDSLSSVSCLKSIFSYESLETDYESSDPPELLQDTYTALLSSCNKYLKPLQALEAVKSQISDPASIIAQLNTISETLKIHFEQSQKHKETAFIRLKRLSKKSSHDLSLASQSIPLPNPNVNSLFTHITHLKNKIQLYTQKISTYDQLLLETTEKLNQLETVTDEIEIKLQEFFSAELRDLHKDINSADSTIGEMLEKVSKQILGYSEETCNDLLQRLESLVDKLKNLEDLGKVKVAIKDLHWREFAKAKSELQERVNELDAKVVVVENERNLLGNVVNGLKFQLNDNLIKAERDKEIASEGFKNSIVVLKVRLEEAEEENNRLKEEVEDLQKEIRECKKQMRSKDYEISELKEANNKN